MNKLKKQQIAKESPKTLPVKKPVPKRKRSANIDWMKMKREYIQGDIASVQEFLRSKFGAERGPKPYMRRNTVGWTKQRKQMGDKAILDFTDKNISKISDTKSKMLETIDQLHHKLMEDFLATDEIEDIEKRVKTRQVILDLMLRDTDQPTEAVRRVAIMSRKVDETLSPELVEYVKTLSEEAKKRKRKNVKDNL